MALLPVPNVVPFARASVLGGLCLAVPAAVVLDGSTRWTVVAVIASAIVWIQLAWFVAWSGAARPMAGLQAQRSTANVLRRLGEHGWRLMRKTSLGHGRSIAHLAIGPGGVLVVETRWRRSVTRSDLESSARHALHGRRQVADVIGAGPIGVDRSAVPVVPLVVVWGPTDPASLPTEVHGVSVVRGEALAARLATIGAGALSEPQVDAAWRAVLERASQRDLYERRRRHEADRLQPAAA